MFNFNNKNVLILSPEDWGENLLSKHLYAQELSKNNNVFFLHTAPHSSQKKFLVCRSINKKITLIHIRRVAKGVIKLPPFLVDIQNYFLIKKIIKKTKLPQIDLVWSFDQSKFQNLKQFNAPLTIFNPVDFIESARPFLNRIANSADITLSVSQLILNQIETTTPKHFINHGLDEIFVTKSKNDVIPKFIDSHKINVAYVGNLQMKFIDWKNLIKTVEENAELNFIFIGPDKKSNIGGKKMFKQIEEIKALPNAYFTGVMSKKELNLSFPFFDAFLLCYDDKKYPIQVSNSHKILEYLSAGKVVLSNTVATYEDTSLIEMVGDNNLLSARLGEIAIDIKKYNNTEKQLKRINYAVNNSYFKQLERVEKILNL